MTYKEARVYLDEMSKYGSVLGLDTKKIQIDGKWISESEFAEIIEEIKEAIDRLVCKGEPVPTVFEVETAMAFCILRNKNVIWLYWKPVSAERQMRRM